MWFERNKKEREPLKRKKLNVAQQWGDPLYEKSNLLQNPEKGELGRGIFRRGTFEGGDYGD